MTFLDRIKETSTSTGTGTFTLGGAVLGYKVFTNGTYKYCIVNETESEWEVGEGTVASGVLTRTTIEASSNGGAAVSFSAGTKYVFNTVSAAYVNSLVPYTGATASVNLGAYGLTSDYLQLSTTPTASGAVGRTIWNDSIGSTQTTLKGGSVVLKNGVDLVARVVNKVSPAATLTKANYKAVRVSGAQGQRLAIAYAQANTDNNSADTIGLVCETIAANQEGFIITVGQLTGINTTGSLQGETWADGDVLYLSPTTAGNLTNIKPTGATGHIVVIGYVEYAHAINGSIYVKIMNGWELDELHNVYINSVANNDVLVYESSSTLWKNKSIATILGYTPANDSLVVHLSGAETITGVKTFQNALQTTAGNNLLNTGGGNTVIGYTADPASSATYKLDVNGATRITGYLNATAGYLQVFDNDAIYVNNNATSNGRVKIFGANTAIWFYTGGVYRGAIGSTNTSMQLTHSGGIGIGANSDLFVNSSGSVYINAASPQASAKFEIVSTTSGFLMPRMTTAQKNAISGPATSLMVYDTDLAAFQYYTGSAWAGLGGGISGSGTAGQVTYWSGTSAVTGSSNLVWDATNSRLSIAAGASPAYRLQVHGSMRIGTTAASAMYWDDTNNRLGIGVTSPTGTLHVVGSGTTFDHNISINGLLLGKGNNNISSNTQFGAFSLISVTTGTFNTALSESSLRSLTTGQYNIAIGANALRYITSANFNVSIGHNSLSNNSNNSSNNVAIGQSALGSNTANNNTGVGYFAIAYNSTGTDNVAIGYNSGVFIADGTTANSTGSQSIYIGSGTKANALSQSNQIVIGYNVTGNGTNTTTIGNSSILATYLAGRTILSASTTSRSSLNIVSGTAPTSPNDGDIWFTGTDLKIQIGGVTKTFTII